MTDFIVLRPWAVVFLIPALVFCFFSLQSVQNWLGIVDSHLLDRLMIKTYLRLKGKIGGFFMILCVFSFVAALCGVSPENGKNSLYEPKSPAVIVLDMSLSMKVKDISPNRISRAVFKIYDLLNELKGLPVSLIVFTDEPYLLVPSTTDKTVIENILPLLSFNLMPSQGSRIDRALEEALKAVKSSGAIFGDIFLITDGAEHVLEIQDKTVKMMRAAALEGTRLFILGAGTPQGGPLFAKEDIPVLDRLGNPVIHGLKEEYLKLLAKEGAGAYARMQTDDADMASILQKRKISIAVGDKSALMDGSLNDNGYWFLILPLFGFPLLFRRGRLLAFLVMFAFPARADAIGWFLSPSAAAMRFFERGEAEKAIAATEKSNDFTALYNVGTKLIFLQDYPRAISLLEKAIQIRPEDENAQVNLEIARRLNEQPADGPSNAPKQGEGGAGNNLNQNNNNTSQDNENKDDNSQSSGGVDGPDQDGEGDNGGEASDGNSGGENDEISAGEGEGEGNGGSGSSGNENEKNGDNSSGQNGEGDNGGEASDGNSGGENDETSAGEGEGEGNGGSGSSGNENKGDKEDNEGNAASSDDQKKNKGIVPVREDPLTLLRHKILFLHQEKRYNDENYFGAQW